ncbi:MAG: right-handed parallel beta-helix repeat-containing protein [Sphaerobacter sp.]|nr:right-handed parallel beta-helix repeat-containing protein [Sphaerobacter sp.]
MADARHEPRGWSRRDFLKLVVGSAVSLPVVAWVALPGAAAGATPGRARKALTRTPARPTPVPRARAKPTPRPSAKQPPTPTPSRSIPDDNWVNVRDFGAAGNGRADDTSAISAALATAKRRGARLYVPAGTYRVTRTVVIDSPLRITGEGRDAVTIAGVGTMDILAITRTSGVEIAGLTLTNLSDSAEWGEAIHLTDASDITIQQCRFTHLPDTAVGLIRVARVTVADCEFSDVQGSGVRLHDPGAGGANAYVYVRGNTFKDVAKWDAAGHAAVQAHGGAGFTQAHVWVENNYVESRSVGIGLDAVDYATVINNRIVGNGVRGEGIAFTGAHNRIEGNQINNAYAAGILVWGVNYRAIADNVIQGNTCWDNAQGIAIVCGQDGTVIDGLQVVGNRCYASSPASRQQFGVQSYIDGATDFTWVNVVIAHNDLRGNTVGPINLVPPSQATITNNLG